MAKANANGIQIEYDTFGERSSPPLLLIIGWATQMIGWDEELCKEWARKGFYVIRFDNRDIGLSTKMEEAGVPDLMAAIKAGRKGEKVDAPYTLDHMGDDTVGLLDALEIDKAHLCGFSMGAVIAQTIAIRYPSRIRSMTLVSATTAPTAIRALMMLEGEAWVKRANPELPRMRPEFAAISFAPPPEEREAYLDYAVKLYRVIAGPGFPFDEVWHRDLAGRSYERSFYPPGAIRQAVAHIAHRNRKPALASVTVPTLIIHGADDLVFPVECGKDVAQAIPGSNLMIIEGMGHDMPHGSAWPHIVEAVVAHARKSDGL